MMVFLTKIRADVLERTSSNKAATSSLVSAPDCIIADIFREIQPYDKHFLKCLTDQFLSEEQKTALVEDTEQLAAVYNVLK